MTISKGSPYGNPAELPAGASVAPDDAALAALLASGTPETVYGLDGGDLFGSLGGRGSVTHRYPVDLGWCELDDGTRHWFAAHLVARTHLWSGPFAVVMNATHLGPWNLGPRAHPNDGLLDITYGRLAPRQRILARKRLVSGTHLPHPDLTLKRIPEWSTDFGTPRRVWADRVAIGRTRMLTVGVRPDAGCVVI